ncbi:MAG TPA: N-acetyl-gamma-glutamyl-phosphate reductase [Blastocatellia bacterium]|nr:N-acetyl-gamma-glutamyl-phosphate reductase [Blastocatellia bacterium]
MDRKVRAIVAGATGYSGRELIRLLVAHPRIELAGAFASRQADPMPLASIHPQLTGLTALECRPFNEAEISRLDAGLIFLSTPNEFSHEVVPPLVETGATVVDLSGAFRLREAALYPKFYGFEHTRPDLLERAVYGITEFAREELRGAKLVANPGCYPTSILIPLVPLIKAGVVASGQPIIADSKSGVTGAGKTPSAGTHFVEVSESFKTYNIFRHRHQPEIAQGLGVSRAADSLVFTPHLLPINRGILSTIYVRLKAGVTRKDIHHVWHETFAQSPFVRIFDGAQLPEIKFAANMPYCDIGCSVEETGEADAPRQAVIVSAEDNLLKGAASQALQNANLALGFEEDLGIRIWI